MTQIEFVKKHLIENGQISRNFCLSNFISRLGARIDDLKRLGWEVKGENIGGDYVYKLVSKPEIPVKTYIIKDSRLEGEIKV